MMVCEWYALCTNTATMMVRHPVLGEVPTCNRCADKHHLHNRARRLMGPCTHDQTEALGFGPLPRVQRCMRCGQVLPR